MLPQEKLANALLMYNLWNSYIPLNKIKELLQKYNLKLKNGKTINDIRLAFGRGLKNTYGNNQKAMEQIAEEIDKICIIARWDF